MSTRPRIKFDHRGHCNACVWTEKKKTLDWTKRQEQLNRMLDKYRGKSEFDCVVPVSGGKDGSHVAYNLKHNYGMNPLCITIRPPLELDLGRKNLMNFINSGYAHMHITPDPEPMRKMNLYGFDLMGFPYFGWMTAIEAGVIRTASQLDIHLIFYGEDGEVEYGGVDKTQDDPFYDVEYQEEIYLEGGLAEVFKAADISFSESFFFKFPAKDVLKKKDIHITHWSYFENWDPYKNYMTAKTYCGLEENTDTNSGTFTNFAQNDQKLYALHTYLMYLKFGFGRATQDAGIEIRRGAMDRDQAINLVKLYDGLYPHEYIDNYLDYFQIYKEKFDSILDKWVNQKLFEKDSDGIWQPKFEVGVEFDAS